MKTKIVLLAALFTSLAGFSQKKWTLKECVDHALKNNITVKQNQLNVDLAEKDVAIAKGSFLPDLTGSVSQRLNFGSFIGQSGARISRDTRGNSFGLNSNTTLFNGFRNLNTYKQAQLGVDGAKLDLEFIKNDISLRVVNTYLNVLFAKENLSVAEIQAEISKKQIDRAKAQFEAGAIPKGDLLNVQSTATNDLQNVVTQENGLNLALLNLSQLLQVSSQDFDVAKIEVGSPSAALLYSDSKTVYEKALTNRPEIKKAKLNLTNADLNVEITKSSFLPSLSFNAGVNTSYQTVLGEKDIIMFQNPDGTIGSRTNRFFTQLSDNLGYGFSLNLNIPIFNRFQTKNRVTKSIINKEQSEFTLESEKLKLEQQIETSFLDAKAAAKTYEAAEISLEAQKEAFKNAQVSYDYGSMTQFDFDQVRNRLVNAEGAMIRAKYDYVFKTKVLKFYFGESIVD
ncbi:TolC family protein [Tenacibaculum sp. S7007]|uniref:TolC family protein n=1 Tax=Tenacibaculum pelagium TaxID=2759527 RepID=A0A839AP38_9FLAO|nr:TolC family protein [Tenacibaculum pelagium]MBA6156140.1 TolC family protein [Tenacibaculum pelagium]